MNFLKTEKVLPRCEATLPTSNDGAYKRIDDWFNAIRHEKAMEFDSILIDWLLILEEMVANGEI